LVGDSERERAAASLQDHFVKGRLSTEELGTRIDLALHARSRSELRAALRDLPRRWPEGHDLFGAGADALHKGALVLAFFATATVWAICSFALALPFALTLLALGPSVVVATIFAALWGVMTFALWRPWFRFRHSPTRPASG
jgi:uncharacterized protein DUF1707